MAREVGLHPAQHRSHKATMIPKRASPRTRAFFLPLIACAVLALPPTRTIAQAPTGPQHLAFAGLRGMASQGQINAIQVDASGDLYLLLNQNDGVHLLKTEPTATSVLAQAQLGAQGDIGLSMALDPSGNVYVAGTTTSAALAGTPGAAFPQRSGTSVNSFVAKFDAGLNTTFVTFAGSGRLAITALAVTGSNVFVTGSLFAATLPVTPNAIQQTPAQGSTQNGFVEAFSADGSTLAYATYLTGANGDTSPAAIAADATGSAYVAGYTTASGFPTIAALVPRIPPAPTGSAPASGFLTRLTPPGDGIVFSTFIPGNGVSSLAMDTTAANLLLSGDIALGLFPVATVQMPLVATSYQVLVRLPLDGSAVLASTLLAPATQSFVASSADGSAWVDGILTTPRLPLAPLASVGSAFAVRVSPQQTIDQTLRLGGLAADNLSYASAPVTLTAIAVNAAGQPLFAGAFQPTASSSLLATQRFDLPLESAPTTAFPSSVTDTALPASSTCSGSLCAGSAGYLAILTPDVAAPSLALSTGASPDIVLRNLGSAQATGVQITATGFTIATTCGTTLDPGAECAIALSGAGPGTLTAQAANAPTQTAPLPATTTLATPIAFTPHELDFGVQTATSAPILRTVTIANLTRQTQTFTTGNNAVLRGLTLPFSESSSDCITTGAPGGKTLAPGASCHLTLAFALNATVPDGPVQSTWTIDTAGAHGVVLTGYAQSAALSTSSPTIDFGTQFAGGLHTARFLYLSNNSDAAITHSTAALPVNSPFTLADACPASLPPHSVCQLQLTYAPAAPQADDAATLTLDHGLTVPITGETIPQPGIGGTGTNPNLGVTPSAIVFADPVPLTGVSATTHTVTISNIGPTAFALSLTLTGDFTDTTNCGTTLAAMSTCSVVLSFAPTQPGLNGGTLTVRSGAGFDPLYVPLSGVGTSILFAVAQDIDFGEAPITEPRTQVFKISQPFQTFAAHTTGNFTAVLVEDIGFGFGHPAPSRYQTDVTGTCLNCFLAIRFLPTEPGPRTGTLTLTSANTSTPYTLNLSGIGLPLFGPLLTPVRRTFPETSIHSKSQSVLFTLTNFVIPPSPITITPPTLTGDFNIVQTPTGGLPCSGQLALAATCLIEVAFTPTAAGDRTGTLTIQTSAGTVSAALDGLGLPDPGIALSPTTLIFEAVPGITATQQTVTLTNTGTAAVQIGPFSTSDLAFTPTGTCATLAPGASCTATVTYTPSNAPASASLQVPVTAVAGTAQPATYTVPLFGAYTITDAGLQIVPRTMDFGPALIGSIGATRTFTVNNLTAKSLALTLSIPRQFALTTPTPCPTLNPNASCNVTITHLPVAAADATGTIYAQGTPTDNTPPVKGIAYFSAYGTPRDPSTLTFSGPLSPGTGILDFGQVASGQTLARTLTLTNTSADSPLPTAQNITIRRIVANAPFLSTTTCGQTLTPRQTCTVTVTYHPLNEVATGSPATAPIPNTSLLTVESDASSSPDLIALSGSAAPVQVSTPAAGPIATYALSTGSLTFPTTGVGDVSPAQTLTLTNTGTATLNLAAIQSTPDYTVANACPAAVVAGASCTVSVTFTPQASGIRSGTLSISSDSTVSLDFVTLFGISSPSPLLVAAQTLDFGTLQVGTSASLPVQITNNGQVPVTFTAVAATGDYTAAGNCPPPGGSLAPATSCTVQVTFAPTAPGTRTGTLSLATTATTLPLTVALTGIGTQSHLSITPGALAFGSIAVGSPANLSLTLANTGTAPIATLALAISGDYAITVPCILTTLAPGQTCAITVTFTPTLPGPRPGTLTVTSSATTEPVQVPLTGTGVVSGSFTLTVDGAQTASATIKSGNPATYTLTVTPTGGFSGTVVLNCTPLNPIPYATCSILPSSILLTASAQNATLTINTVTAAVPVALHTTLNQTLLAIIAPGLLVLWRPRKHRQALYAILAAALCLSVASCGGGPNPNLRFVNPGTYRYQVTATSTTGTVITQSVSVTLIVTN